MPDLGITEILGIASLVAGGVGTGVSVAENSANRSAQQQEQQSAQQAQQQQQTQQSLLQRQQALAVAGPNAQSQTGGSLTGQGQDSFANILAGYAGNTGGGGNTPQPQAGAGNPLQALLSQLQGAQSQPSLSGGSAQTPTNDPNAISTLTV